ncbi:MAG: ATPase P [Desulfobulbaceae bacterium]|nr:ATPase P [Desulfobulbaceae bacterium]
MFELDIPGFGNVGLQHLVTDFTGTLSVDGKLAPEAKWRLDKVAEFLDVHVLTADTFGRAGAELAGINCEVRILEGKDHDVQKEAFVRELGADTVIALGNGKNDRKMLRTARIGIAVCLQEGCATDAVLASDIMVVSIVDALDLLLNRKRLKATLRF